MKKRIAVLGLGAVVGAWFFLQGKSVSSPVSVLTEAEQIKEVAGRGLASVPVSPEPAATGGSETAASVSSSAAPTPAASAAAVATAEKAKAFPPLSEGEKKSIQTLTRLLADSEKRTPQQLAARLKTAGLQPQVVVDANPDTGKMTVTRTKNTLPGTRYFHAQIVETESGESLVQHMSFEVRPGPDSMVVATARVREMFPDLGTPNIQREDYLFWRKDGRVVSLKRMNEEDLKHNYFNAHSKEDVGTVWVTIEIDPEEDGHEHRS